MSNAPFGVTRYYYNSNPPSDHRLCGWRTLVKLLNRVIEISLMLVAVVWRILN